MVPSLIRDVRAATTASTSQGSMIGGPSPLLENTMWSHRKNPSNPACFGRDAKFDQPGWLVAEIGNRNTAEQTFRSPEPPSAAASSSQEACANLVDNRQYT